MSGRRNRRGGPPDRKSLSPAAWASLYADCYPRVRAWFAARGACATDAEDLAEQVFAALARGTVPDDPQAYIAGVAANVLARYRRRQVRERAARRILVTEARRDEEEQRRGESEEAAAGEAAGPESGVSLESLLDGLPAPQALLLRLRFVDGLPMARIAHQVGCSRAAAYKRLERLLRELRRTHGVTPIVPGDKPDRQNPR